jgi:hypothetical protein
VRLKPLNEFRSLFDEPGKFMLAGEGLKASSNGKRVRFAGENRTVIDGPFAESKELIAGYTLIQVKSREEALEWTKRFPNPVGEEAAAEIEAHQHHTPSVPALAAA